MPSGPDRATREPNPSRSWVRESTFGTWFLGTSIWTNHVLRVALDDLERLIIPRRDRYLFILDVGCGRGQALPMLEGRFKPDTLVGLDVDQSSLDRAKDQRRRCRCRIELLEGNAEKIDLSDGTVDMVLCHQTFHHLIDQESAIREIHRVLRPGGTLLFAESCRRFIHSLPIRILFRHPMEVQKSAAEYLALLRSAGFDIGPGNLSTPYLWWSRPDLGILEWIGRPIPAEREETLVNVAATRLP